MRSYFALFSLFCLVPSFAAQPAPSLCKDALIEGLKPISEISFDVTQQEEIWKFRSQGKLSEANVLEEEFARALQSAVVVEGQRVLSGHGQSGGGANSQKYELKLDIGVTGLFKFHPLEWRREVTGYRLAKLFRFPNFEVPVVVPFVFQGKQGSLQVYIHRANRTNERTDFRGWMAMQIFDFIIGNGDRHSGHNSLFEQIPELDFETLIGIDHGFAIQPDGKQHWRIIPHTYSEALRDPEIYKVIKGVTDEQIYRALSLFNSSRDELAKSIISRRNRVIDEMEFHLREPKVLQVRAQLRPEDASPEISTRVELRPAELSDGKNILIGLFDGNSTGFRNIDLRGVDSLSFKLASGGRGGSIRILADGREGEQIAEVRTPNTGGWHKWVEVTVPIKNVNRIADLHFVYWDRFHAHPHNEKVPLLDLRWVKLNRVEYTRELPGADSSLP